MQEITKALIKFQGLVKNPQKNSKNPHFRSSYVNLDGLLEAVKKPLTESGLYLSQTFKTVDGMCGLETRLIHESGESIDSFVPVSPDKANIQGFGSCVTYLRRYSLESICGITGSDDDDGNAAVTYGNNVQKSPGQRKTIEPSEKQIKFLKTLIKEKHGEISQEMEDKIKTLDIKSCSEQIERLKGELGK